MPDSKPLVLIVRHVGAEPEVVYDDNHEVDIWFADSTFAPDYYNNINAQIDDVSDLAVDAAARGEAEIAERLRSLAAGLTGGPHES